MRMRIIAGSLGGQWFKADVGNRTHPTAERVRGGLFNSLGDLTDKTVLDAFAGTGAYSFEAVSRGAKSCLAIERDRKAQQSIQDSILSLNVAHRVKLVKANCSSWSDNNPSLQFDIVLCDVPYDDLQLATVAKLTRHLKPTGVLVVSHPGKQSSPNIDGITLLNSRNYGDATLSYYEKSSD
ncbi:MAG TPA: RsmD family RNA methyltransferase [Patescibacteria group bacterium]|nr:RsmD family RNA methyltransferase [Patescibacteria group bacterium]